MKKLIFICVFLNLLIFAMDCKKSQDEIELQKQDFEQQLMEAIEIADSSTVIELIKSNRYKVGSVMEKIYNLFLKNETKYEDKKASKRFSDAQWIADVYQDIFQDDHLIRRLHLFQSWEYTQKLKKLKLDSLRNQAAQFFEINMFEDCIDLNLKSSEINDVLGDMEYEARILNSLGLCYSKLHDFYQAEKYLKQALKINNEIGLKFGIMITLNNIGDLYQKQRKFDEALNYFHQSLKIAEEIGDKASAGSRWSNLGDTYHRMEDKDKAIECLLKALEIAKRIDDLSLQSIVFLNLGAVHLDLSKIKQALKFWKEGLEISRKLKDRKMEGSFLSNMGGAYRNINKYDSALICLKAALKITQKTRNFWTEANTLREIGVNLYLKGKPDSALIYWNHALEKFQSIPDTSGMGIVTCHIGVYYKNTGQPYKALDYFDKALELSRKVGNKREESNILCNKGNVYNDLLGEYGKAENLFKKALEIKQELGEIHFEAVILENLGICCKNRGDYQKALEYFFNALRIGRETSHKAGEAKSLSDIGATYTDLGDYQKAASYYENALSIFQEIKEVKPQIEILMNLGSNFLSVEKVDSAFTNFKQALDLALNIKHKEFEGLIYFYLGDAYQEKGDNQQALEHYNMAFKKLKETHNFKSQGELYTAKGDIYYELKDYNKASANYKKGLQIARKIGSPEGTWEAYYGIGKVEGKLGEDEKAIKNYKEAIETIESIRAKLKARTLKESFMNDKIDVYISMINLLLKMGRDDDAFKYLERSKARTFLDIISTGRIEITEGITKERLERKKELERKLNKTHQSILNEYSKNKEELDFQQISFLEDTLRKLQQLHNELLQEIELNHSKYSSLIGITEPLNLKQVRERVIHPSTVLLEYLVEQDQTIIWAIGDNFYAYEKINLKREDLEEMVKSLLQPFKNVKERKILSYSNIGFNLKLSRKLYEQIFKPIEKYLEEGNNLIIVPDGILYYIPFEALVISEEKGRPDSTIIFSRFKNVQYLVEKYTISYSHSASILDPIFFRKQKIHENSGKSLVFCSPYFGDAAVENKRDMITLKSLVNDFSKGWAFSELPKSKLEGNEVANIMNPSLLYVGKNAKEEAFKLNSSNFPYIHISTHCIMEESQPLYSRIVFTQDEDPTEDGLLHTHEVFNLRLNAELVTLSACETGLGKLTRGEGIIGLTRAFMYAGTPSVLVSLWSVDESTAEIMKYFYKNLNEGLNKSEALRQAKLKLLKSNGTFENGTRFSFAHPFLWAPFILVGN